MKKLMFTLAAVAAMVATAEVSSSNIVGFGEVNDDNKKSTGVGAIFFPVGNVQTGAQFNLLDLVAKGAEDGAYMDPVNECIRYLDPETTATTKRFTYVSPEWITDNITGDEEETMANYSGAFGWWFFNDKEYSIEDMVNDMDFSKRVSEPQMFPVGTAFMGNFLRNGVRICSQGEVSTITTEFRDNRKKSPLFMNYLPIEIDISDMTVAGDGEGDYMDPVNECIRYLDPETTATTVRYTYVSPEWITDNITGDEEETMTNYSEAFGWWFFNDKEYSIEDMVNDMDFSKRVLEPVAMRPGYAFMANTLRNNLRFRFPGATSAPSK